MAEVYSGAKFSTVLSRRKLREGKSLSELIIWCRRFKELGFAPSYDNRSSDSAGSAGNLSFRPGPYGRFVITAAYTDLGNVKAEDLVRVTGFSLGQRKVYAEGLRVPSSETLMHAAVYAARPDVKAVFHGHSDVILRSQSGLGLVATKNKAGYGTVLQAREVLRILGQNNFIVIRGHGFLSLGKTMGAAGMLAESVLEKLNPSCFY